MVLPKSWSEVIIDTFLKYYTVSTKVWSDSIDREVHTLSVFSGIPVDEIEKLKTKELSAHLKKLDFLKELPSTKIATSFYCNGGRYKPCLTMDEMRAVQFMNFSTILKDVTAEDRVYQMHKLLGAFCIKRFYHLNYPFIKYQYTGYKESSEVFLKHMTMDVAYPYYVFFCNVMDKSLASIQSYLEKKLLREMKLSKKSQKQKGQDLNTTGAGTL